MLSDFIQHYGALAVFVGAAAEGETAAFLGGVIAHRHLVAYWQVALAATLGSFLADQAFFFIGRRASRSDFVQRKLALPASRRVLGMLEDHPVGFILAFRFIYGMRTISPVIIGLSGIPVLRFLLLNALAAVVWGVLFTAAGYLLGNTIEALFGRLHLPLHMLIALGAVVLLVAAFGLLAYRAWGRGARE